MQKARSGWWFLKLNDIFVPLLKDAIDKKTRQRLEIVVLSEVMQKRKLLLAFSHFLIWVVGSFKLKWNVWKTRRIKSTHTRTTWDINHYCNLENKSSLENLGNFLLFHFDTTIPLIYPSSIVTHHLYCFSSFYVCSRDIFFLSFYTE